MARGKKLGALLLWLAGVGCGSSPSTVGEDLPAQTGQDMSLPASNPGTPVGEGTASQENGGLPAQRGGTVDASAVSMLDAPPSLPEPTCIPPKHSAPPIQAQACAITSVWPNGTREQARYDANGRLLELRKSDSVGALLTVETHVWADGNELQRRVTYADGKIEQTDWTYDAQGRLLLRVDQKGGSATSTEYEYEKGLLYWATTRDLEGKTLGWSDFTYDAQGRLTSIDSLDCRKAIHPCESRSYWPDGQLRHHERYTGTDWVYSDDFNTLGQRTGSAWSNGPAGDDSKTTYTFDSEGRLSRGHTLTEKYLGHQEDLTTVLYAPGGWRERFAQDFIRYTGCNWESDCLFNMYYKRTTHRAHYLCGTSTVALEDWDTNEDGVVEARRTHEYDSQGRRVREWYSGTPGLDEGPVSRDYDYECP